MDVQTKRAGLAVAGGLFLIDQLRILIGAGVSFTNEDQTIFWYAAKDYLHLRVYEPLFYGSAYGSHLESWLALPLIALGLAARFAVPLATVALTAAPWILFCAAAWKRGLWRIAIGILLVPLFLPVEYVGINTQAAHGTGAALGGIAAALTVFPHVKRGALFAFGLINAMTLPLYPNIIFIAAPAALILVLERWRERGLWIWAGSGACVGGLASALAIHFYAAHPSFVLHTQWPLDFRWSSLTDGLAHLDRHIGDLTPIGLTGAGFVLFGSLVAIWLSVRTRRWQPGLACLMALVGVLLSLGVPKTHDGSPSITFAYARVYLGVPLLLPFLAILWGPFAPQVLSPRSNAALAAALLAVALWREATLGPELDRMMAVGSPVVSVVPTERVLAECEALRSLAVAQGAPLVIFRESRVNAYACGALWYGSLETLYPPYERRRQRLVDERDRLRTAVLVADADPQLCVRATAQGLQCEWLASPLKVALVHSAGISAVALAGPLGLSVRRF